MCFCTYIKGKRSSGAFPSSGLSTSGAREQDETVAWWEASTFVMYVWYLMYVTPGLSREGTKQTVQFYTRLTGIHAQHRRAKSLLKNSAPEVSPVLVDHASFKDAQPWCRGILLWSPKQLRRNKKARSEQSGQCAATGKYVSLGNLSETQD